MKYKIICIISNIVIISLIVYDLKFADTKSALNARGAIALFLYAIALAFEPEFFISDEKYTAYIFTAVAVMACFISLITVA